jgi:hypothetical protein
MGRRELASLSRARGPVHPSAGRRTLTSSRMTLVAGFSSAGSTSLCSIALRRTRSICALLGRWPAWSALTACEWGDRGIDGR